MVSCTWNMCVCIRCACNVKIFVRINTEKAMILVYFLAFLQRSLTEKLDFNTLIIVLLRAESVMSLALLLLLLPLLLFSFHLYIFLFLSDTKQMCLSRRTLNKFYIYGAQYVRGLVCVCVHAMM